MSVFRVKLQNSVQGLLDVNPTTGVPVTTSVQRTMYAPGPKGAWRELKDGEEFTDSNYWKRFAYPQTTLEDAFIEVVTDDGSVYSDVPSENVYLKVYNVSVASGSDFEDNVVDVIGDTNSYAIAAEIVNQGSTAVQIRVNGSDNAVFDLAASSVKTFNIGEINVTSLEFLNIVSGGADSDVQVILTIKSVSNS